MKDKNAIIVKLLEDGAFIVDPDTGEVYSTRANKLVGSVDDGRYVRICTMLNGARFKLLAHRVVWIDTNGYTPEEIEIDHINNDKTDNRLCNLQALSKAQNCAKALKDGLLHKTAKLSQKDAVEIRKLRGEGMLQKDIGALYGVAQSQIHRILTGKRWKGC